MAQIGSINHNAKLNEKKVAEIKRLYGLGYSYNYLAAAFEVHHKTIYDIIREKKWKHVQLEKETSNAASVGSSHINQLRTEYQ